MIWRAMTLYVALGALSRCAAATAEMTPAVNVVKLISFDCAICAAAESLDGPIRAAVEQGGGRFVVAPLPRAQTDVRERFYYALREQGGVQVESTVRQSLFKASQELNYPLTDLAETLDWLRQDLQDERIDWDRVVSQVESPAGLAPVRRAMNLVAAAGAQVTPTYLLVRNGVVIRTVDLSALGSTNLSALREAVLAALHSASITPTR